MAIGLTPACLSNAMCRHEIKALILHHEMISFAIKSPNLKTKSFNLELSSQNLINASNQWLASDPEGLVLLKNFRASFKFTTRKF